MSKKIIFCFLFSALTCESCCAIKCVSITNGLWETATTWNTNSVPYAGDTIIIKHTVTSAILLHINNNNLTIESNAMLCCKNDLDIGNYSYLLNYGKIKASKIYVHTYAHLENIGYIDVYGGLMSVNTLTHGSLHNAGGALKVYIGYRACCIHTQNYFDNSTNKFSYQIIGNTTVKLAVNYPDALVYEWQFSNGNKSGETIQYTFPAYGKNAVTLIEEDSCFTNYYVDEIEIPSLVYNAYYNFVSNQIIVTVKNAFADNFTADCILYDLTGRKVLKTIVSLSSTNDYKATINLPSLAPSAYIATCTFKNQNITNTIKIISGIK